MTHLVPFFRSHQLCFHFLSILCSVLFFEIVFLQVALAPSTHRDPSACLSSAESKGVSSWVCALMCMCLQRLQASEHTLTPGERVVANCPTRDWKPTYNLSTTENLVCSGFLTGRLGSLTTKCQGTFCLHLPNTGIAIELHYIWFFMRMLGIKLRP